MNYYQQIQRSIDFIETHLTDEINVEACAREAMMSVSGYYRMFLSMVGYSVKEYIRLRRLTQAWKELSQGGLTVMAAAVRYGYTSADSFARAFKKSFGLLPSRVKGISCIHTPYAMERVDIMERYFDHDSEYADKYPDIKVIRELPAMPAACFTYYGDAPEDHAFAVLKEWAWKHRVHFHGQGYRVFGYNHPDPQNENETYGYEVCVTIPQELYDQLEDVPAGFERGTYDGVKRRIISGGRYAVMSVRRREDAGLGEEIYKAWRRFVPWLKESRYTWGSGQYLEEHLDFDQEDRHVGGVDLYVPIRQEN